MGEQAGTALGATRVDGLRASRPQREPAYTLDPAAPPPVVNEAF